MRILCAKNTNEIRISQVFTFYKIYSSIKEINNSFFKPNYLKKQRSIYLLSSNLILKYNALIAEANFIQQLTDPKTKEKAFLKLLDTYQERLYWYIRKIVITHENADDALQNTFVRIYRNIASFKGNSSLSTWLFRIAHNEAIRLLEKQNKMHLASLEDVQPQYLEDLTQDNYFDGDEVKLKLHQIIESKLTNKQRMVFNMKYFDDLSFRQMSEILGMNENTLKSSYYSATKIIEGEIVI